MAAPSTEAEEWHRIIRVSVRECLETWVLEGQAGSVSVDALECHRECKTPHLEEVKIPHPLLCEGGREMSIENEGEPRTMGPEVTPHEEVPMVRQER